MRYGLPEATIERIGRVLACHPQVEEAILYGSRAKGTYKNGSDIDLTLRSGADLTLPVLYRIADELDDLLLPYRIDLSIYANINDPAVLDHFQRVGCVFYAKTNVPGEPQPLPTPPSR